MIPNKKFVLCVHYNGDNSYLFINGIQRYKFKINSSVIKANKLNLGNISNNDPTSYFSFNGNIYYFSVDYQPATTDKIEKIHKYLMKKMILYK